MTIDAQSIHLHQLFDKYFGRTPIKQGLEDILSEAIEASRYTDLKHLKEELGDLLTSTLVRISECGWHPSELIDETLKKIESKKHQYRTLGRKTCVAILGGSFDPITIDHIRLAKFVLSTSRTFDEVWLMPASTHREKILTPFEHRYKMCQLAIDDPRIKVSDYEHRNGFTGDTLQMFKYLSVDGSYRFSLIMGQDVANSFPTWPNFEHLERAVSMVVVPRVGVEPDMSNPWFLRPPHIYLANTGGLISNGSSTNARTLISEGEDLTGLLCDSVIQYIKDNKLYGAT